MVRFLKLVKESDEAQVSMERQMLVFQREKYSHDVRRYQEEREDRRIEMENERVELIAEQEPRERIEMEKLKFMLDVLRKTF